MPLAAVTAHLFLHIMKVESDCVPLFRKIFMRKNIKQKIIF